MINRRRCPAQTPTQTITPTDNSPESTQPPTATPTITPTPTPIPAATSLSSTYWEKQTANNCGPASLAIYLRYFGWEGDQEDISALIKPLIAGRNVNVEELVYFVRSHAGWLNAEFRVGGRLHPSDNTHPTYTGSTIYVGLIGGSGSGTGAPDYSGSQIVGGKNPVWDRYGHERIGWALSVFNPATP